MKPLEGIKVVELGIYVAVPNGTRILADWGAEVIKIEGPKRDNNRIAGLTFNLPCEDDCNPYCVCNNNGKRLLALDLKKPEGMEVMMRLLSEADIFMSNIRYGGLTRLGLDYETLHEKFPSLVYCHVNAYGEAGPEKDRPGFDMTAWWARSGILNAFRDPGSRNSYPPPGIGDIATSNSAIAGTLSALYHRMRTGEGLKVTTSLYANGLWCHATGVVGGQDRAEVGDGRVPMRTPTHFKEWGNPFYNIYKCKDGRWFYLLGGGYDKLHHTMKEMGLGEYVDDPRFKDHATMVKHCDVMYDMMEEAFLKKTSMEWKEIMEEINTSYEILWNNSDVTEDPQAWANGYLTRVTCPNGLEYVVPTTPVDFDGVEKPEAKHVGTPGCDTSKILNEYGYSTEEIGSLFAAGAALGK